MKKIIIVAIVAIVGGLGLYGGRVWENLTGNTTYIRTEPETVIQTEKVDTLNVLIDEAQTEARPKIEEDAKKTKEAEVEAARLAYEEAVAKAEAKHDKYIVDELTKVSDKVKEDYITQIEATITSTTY